jgi:carbon monoxide dehydrogenase subunit G
MIATSPAAVRQQTSHRSALISGEVMTHVHPHSHEGAAVTAIMHIPLSRDAVWQQLTHYPRWTAFFPNITRSDVTAELSPRSKRITQAASKTFLMLNIEVEIQLQVDEIPQESIRFSMVDGGFSFRNFAAVIELKDVGNGTELSYTVQATPSIPVPAMFIEQAMKCDLPQNMRCLRRVLLN